MRLFALWLPFLKIYFLHIAGERLMQPPNIDVMLQGNWLSSAGGGTFAAVIHMGTVMRKGRYGCEHPGRKYEKIYRIPAEVAQTSPHISNLISEHRDGSIDHSSVSHTVIMLMLMGDDADMVGRCSHKIHPSIHSATHPWPRLSG